MTQGLSDEYFRRQDESNDADFYDTPRKVVHIDNWAINRLRDTYTQRLSDGGIWLDLMSSWRSHYPDSVTPQRVYGLGMNSAEMADNPALDEFIIHNLNRNPNLPYDDNMFDAVTCAVSVQYLTDPIAVFQEVNRVLKPGGCFIVSFSNRCFPTKAVAVWLSTTDRQHVALVMRYLELSGNWQALDSEIHQTGNHNPIYIVYAEKRNAPNTVDEER